MKKSTRIATCLLLVTTCVTGVAQLTPQQPQPPPRADFSARLQDIIREASGGTNQGIPSQPRFDLNFAGGTPGQLIAAIEKASQKPVNAIIQKKDSETPLPALKLKNVTLLELFKALEMASKYTVHEVSNRRLTEKKSGYAFRSAEASPTDESIWYFMVDYTEVTPVEKPQACQFYSLTTYLDRGLTVDDITTAIKTAWKMQDAENTPEISFHKETKLLIAVGERNQLELINAALGTLDQSLRQTAPRGTGALPAARPIPTKPE
jgi:hypothetical protein